MIIFFYLLSCCLISLADCSSLSASPKKEFGARYQKEIDKLVASNPGQLSVEEYRLIAKVLDEKSPCNMLVFGVGRDSPLWMKINRGGKTVFLEDNQEWLKTIQKQQPFIEIYRVVYGTLCSEWHSLLEQPHEKLMLNLPYDVYSTSWDIIFIDGPTGYNDAQPGRMRSIYTGAYLAGRTNNETAVFVHDCDRIIESVYCDTFFDPNDLQLVLDRSRFYLIRKK